MESDSAILSTDNKRSENVFSVIKRVERSCRQDAQFDGKSEGYYYNDSNLGSDLYVLMLSVEAESGYLSPLGQGQ